MGYSPAYNVFAGGAEALGGLLLLFRRTTTLGAVVAIGVLTNIVMLNFCYDVPVKLFSIHLTLMATALAGLDGRRLLNAFVFNRPTPAADLSPHFGRSPVASGLASGQGPGHRLRACSRTSAAPCRARSSGVIGDPSRRSTASTPS